MRKEFSELQQIDNNHQITKDTDSEFLYQLQLALLLALKEAGTLNDMQCRQACEYLQTQKNDREDR